MSEIKSFRKFLYEQPLEPKHMTAEEAFEAGRRSDMTNYDAAARKAARIWLEEAEREPKVATMLKEIDTLDWKNHSQAEHKLFDMAHKTEELMTEQERKEFDAIGLSAFQAGWAIQAAAKALLEGGD